MDDSAAATMDTIEDEPPALEQHEDVNDEEQVDNIEEYGDEGYYDEYGDFIDDDDPSPYHELYLQRHGMEFMMPILFEDGMDYIECELYYASLTSQSSGGAFRKKRSLLTPRRSTARELRDIVAAHADFENNTNGILPCIRKEPRHTRMPPPSPAGSDDKNSGKNNGVNFPTFPMGHIKKSGPPVRRCSFSGMPQILEDFGPPLVRSMSLKGWDEEEPRVCFEEYVQVVTIYPAEEYPEDIRAQIWMSRDEMAKCMRRAMMEDMKEQRDKDRDEQKQRDKDRENVSSQQEGEEPAGTSAKDEKLHNNNMEDCSQVLELEAH